MNFTAVDRQGNPHRLEAAVGDVLMEVLRDAGLGVEAVCGGCRACATCHIYVPPWAVPGRGDDEQALLSACGYFDPASSRLSCQITLTAQHEGMQVSIAPEE